MKTLYGWLWSAAGSAECRLIGALPAGFLNRCSDAGVCLGNVEPVSETELRLTLPLRSLRRAQQIARRSQCELTPLRRSGVSILARRALRRGVPVFCLLAAFALLGWSKLYIWEIGISGNQTVSDGAVRAALSDCGVGLGTFWPDLVSDNLRSELLVRLPQLAWATVNIHGSRAEVIVRERIPKPALLDADEPVDLVAERAGFVTAVQVLNGSAVVRAGSAVLPGEVLITGRADSAFAGSRETHALGSVTAETYYELSAAVPLTETLRTGCDRARTRWALLIGRRRINLYRSSSFCPPDWDQTSTIRECRIKGLFSLPLALVRVRSAQCVCEERSRDPAAARRDLEQQLHARLLAAVDGGEVKQETFSCSESEGRLVVCLRARCSEDIATEKKR